MGDITELSTAFTLCMCSDTVCSRTCPICYSPRWVEGPCVQQLWREHASSDAGKRAAQAFNDMVKKYKPGDIVTMPTLVRGEPGPPSEPDPPVLTDAEIVERTIDFTEQLGMYLEPWQATALRAILLHGGDVAIGVRHR